MLVPRKAHGHRWSGVLVEPYATAKIISDPSDPRTENHVTGRSG